MRAGADTLIWGTRAEPESWRLQSTLDDIARGDLSLSLTMMENRAVKEALLDKLQPVAQESIESLLCVASSICLRSPFSPRLGLGVEGEGQATLHILAQEQPIYDSVFRPKGETACGIKARMMMAAKLGRWENPGENTRCPDCLARDIEIKEDDIPSIPGLDVCATVAATLQRLSKREVLTSFLPTGAVRSATIKAGTSILAKEALQGGEDLLLKAWGVNYFQQLKEAEPNFYRLLDHRFWKRWFVAQSYSDSSATLDRITLARSVSALLPEEKQNPALFW